MQLPIKLCLLVLFASLVRPVFAQREQDVMLEWFNGFFNKKMKSDSLLSITETRLQAALQDRDVAAEARERKQLALLHITTSYDYETAMEMLVKVMTIEDSLQLKKEQIFTYLAISTIFERVGDYENAAKFLDQAKEMNTQAGSDEIRVKILTESGKVKAAQNRIDEAYSIYLNVLELSQSLSDDSLKAEILFRIGHLNTQQGDYEKALVNHRNALKLWRQLGIRRKEARSLNDISELYRLMKNESRAFENLKLAIEIQTDLKDKKGLADSHNNLGILYYEQKNYPLAIENLRKALEESREAHDQDALGEAFEYLALCYRDTGDFEKAFEYTQLLLSLRELLQSEKNQQQVVEKEKRYEIAKKENEIGKLENIRIKREKELQEQKRVRNFLFGFLALGFVIVVLVTYLYLLKRKSNRALRIANETVRQQNIELQQLNATKDKFFSIISHDLKGPLNSLTSFSGLLINHTDSLSKDEIRMLATDLDKSLKNLFALLENLLEWSRSQTGNIEFKPEEFDISELLQLNRDLLHTQAQNKKIQIVNKATSSLKIYAHKHSVNTVIRNLISNAIKFTPPNGHIFLDVKTGNSKMMMVSITDTGVGMSEDVVQKLFRIDTKHSTRGTADEKGTGLGLILCKDFVEKNGGELKVKSEVGKGSVFYFTLPLAQTEVTNMVSVSPVA